MIAIGIILAAWVGLYALFEAAILVYKATR